MLKELFNRIRNPKDEIIRFNIGPVTVEMEESQWRELVLIGALGNVELNLELARKDSIKPVSLEEIYAQVNHKDIGNMVLYDTPPRTGQVGNHWRIVDKGNQTESATLQLCGTFGIYDYDKLPPIKVPLDAPLFTGVSFQWFEYEGEPATLSEVAQLIKEAKEKARFSYPDSLEYIQGIGDNIFFSDSEGILTPIEEHSLIKDRSQTPAETQVQ